MEILALFFLYIIAVAEAIVLESLVANFFDIAIDHTAANNVCFHFSPTDRVAKG